ncbi:hypothetical protein ATG_14350 [Desulfurococcaceae archaeon AG1]|jgi:hypothetical protein|nr:hypothetical protein ATG_14350 [Desulfurococcaceae archaeon AG1]
MASTFGGFLLGFGLCLLLIGLGVIAILGIAWRYVAEPEEELEHYVVKLYNVIHSQEYEKIMRALKTLSLYTDRLVELIGEHGESLGIQHLGEHVKLIPNASHYMENIYSLSETAFLAMSAFDLVFYVAADSVHRLSWLAVVLGLILTAIGAVLLVRSRRRRIA